jgi:hypothetical protein
MTNEPSRDVNDDIATQPVDDADDRPSDEFIAEMLKEHPEAREWLTDEYQNGGPPRPVGQRVEHGPQDIPIVDQEQARLVVEPARGGYIRVNWLRPRKRYWTITLTRHNALELADALTWAAKRPDPASPDPENHGH